jgi:hypothetical protein
MDFAWTEEQLRRHSAIIEFARAELNDGLIDRDRACEFNHAGWKRCAEMGIQGLPVPVELGGQGLDALGTVGALEALGYACKDNGLVFAINAHMWTAIMPMLAFGSDEQKHKYLPGLCNGELIGGTAMTEPEAGSDAYSMKTTARRDGDNYIINGKKVMCTNGTIADVLVVFASVDPENVKAGVTAFLVEKDAPGFMPLRNVEKMGLRTAPLAELEFRDCTVPASQRLGNEGAGKNVFTEAMTWERGCILAFGVGAMQRLLEVSTRRARTRHQFGKPIGKLQLVASKIVDMKVRLETARALLYRQAWLKSTGKSPYLEAALAKLHISECWVRCAEDAVQIHGGYGYMTEHEIERELRDAIASRIYSGTSEIQRVISAQMIGL